MSAWSSTPPKIVVIIYMELLHHSLNCSSSLRKGRKGRIWKYLEQFFCLSPVQIFQKSILTNLKIPRTTFCLSPFQIFQKSILTNLKIPRTIFCLSPFLIFKKSILKSLKIPRTIFLLIPFSNITNLKNTSFYTNNNLHKSHYTNRLAQSKIYNQCMYTHNYYKFFFTFYKKML